MKEPEFIYTSNMKYELRDTFPSFYYQLLAYVESLPGNYYLTTCYNPDGDGARFNIILHNLYNQTLSISAIKQDSTYNFSINQ